MVAAVVLVELWKRLYNIVRPHSARGVIPPAPEAIKPSPSFLEMPQLQGPPIAAGLTLQVVPHPGARQLAIWRWRVRP